MAKTDTSKLGVLCLIVAIVTLVIYDLPILSALGLLYYAYKLLYRKEKPSRTDKIIIIVLTLLGIALFIYFAYTLTGIAGYANALP